MNLTALHVHDVAGNLRSAQPEFPELRKSLNRVMGATFVDTVFKISENSVFKSEVMSGGRGEQVFRRQLNSLLVRRVSESGRLPLADAIYDKVIKQPRYRQDLSSFPLNQLDVRI